jgi:hypothetical protein
MANLKFRGKIIDTSGVVPGTGLEPDLHTICGVEQRRAAKEWQGHRSEQHIGVGYRCPAEIQPDPASQPESCPLTGDTPYRKLRKGQMIDPEDGGGSKVKDRVIGARVNKAPDLMLVAGPVDDHL